MLSMLSTDPGSAVGSSKYAFKPPLLIKQLSKFTVKLNKNS